MSCGGDREQGSWGSGPGVSGLRACEKLSYGQSIKTIGRFLAALSTRETPVQRGWGLGGVSGNARINPWSPQILSEAKRCDAPLVPCLSP